MAERAGGHHHIGACLGRLLDRLDQLAESDVLAGLDDREAAALDLRGVVDRLAAAGLDDRLERPGLIGVLEAEDLGGPQDLAAVERRHLESLEPLVRDLLQALVAVPFGDQPEQVLDLDRAFVGRRAHRLEISAHARAQIVVVLQLPVGLAQVERADVADRHQRLVAGRLGIGQDARVQMQVVVRLGLVDVAGAAAGDRLELVQLDAEPRRERFRRGVQLLGRKRREATRVVGDLAHPSAGGGSIPARGSGSSSRAPDSSRNSIRPSACSPWTIPSAPSRP